jgi:hypothetical protein
MHSFAYDAIHDEIVVTSPLAQAILFFRGSAIGEESPVRVIQGPHTLIDGPPNLGNDRVSITNISSFQVYASRTMAPKDSLHKSLRARIGTSPTSGKKATEPRNASLDQATET